MKKLVLVTLIALLPLAACDGKKPQSLEQACLKKALGQDIALSDVGPTLDGLAPRERAIALECIHNGLLGGAATSSPSIPQGPVPGGLGN